MSNTSSYSQSSFSPMSSPFTPSSQTSESFGSENVFKFPSVIQDQYIVRKIYMCFLIYTTIWYIILIVSCEI